MVQKLRVAKCLSELKYSSVECQDSAGHEVVPTGKVSINYTLPVRTTVFLKTNPRVRKHVADIVKLNY
jgi:hypothetical protein